MGVKYAEKENGERRRDRRNPIRAQKKEGQKKEGKGKGEKKKEERGERVPGRRVGPNGQSDEGSSWTWLIDGKGMGDREEEEGAGKSKLEVLFTRKKRVTKLEDRIFLRDIVGGGRERGGVEKRERQEKTNYNW